MKNDAVAGIVVILIRILSNGAGPDLVREDEKKKKPDPHPYTLCRAELIEGVEPSDCWNKLGLGMDYGKGCGTKLCFSTCGL